MSRRTRVAFVSLGCAKNLVDSEKMLGQLAEAGCAITADESDADVIVINTCGFLSAARDEADAVIREAVNRKTNGRLRKVVVAGCLVQRDKELILDRIPGVDGLVGVNNRDDIVRAVLGSGAAGSVDIVGGSKNDGRARTSRRTAANAPPALYLSDYHPFVQLDFGRLRLTPKHYAYLRISEGCDQKCTFCTIPSIRGRMHCKPASIVLEEARELVGDGAVEISLIGQDTTSYGLGDDPLEGGLAGLLRSLNKVVGLEWLRLMYVYPSVMSDEIIDAIADCDRVCKYIDIPLQHINDRVLKSMHRRINRSQTETLLARIRSRIPGVSIRTTMIAGFPGETDAEFDELLAFVTDFGFDCLGVFPYSLEPETPAGRMKDQIADGLKRERVDRLMSAQQEVAFRLGQSRVGETMRVLIDGVDGEGRLVGRHQGQAPGVDGVTFVEGCKAAAGDFVEARCTAQKGYDLAARPTRVALRVIGS